MVRPDSVLIYIGEPLPSGNWVMKADPVGVENRNSIAASASLTVPASAASGTAIAAVDLTPNPSNDLPFRFAVLVYNGSDASANVTVSDQITVGTSTVPVQVVQISVPAHSGALQVVEGIGLGDTTPIVSAVTTSASTNGGTITVQLRYL
jgi:hypothetical protein